MTGTVALLAGAALRSPATPAAARRPPPPAQPPTPLALTTPFASGPGRPLARRRRAAPPPAADGGGKKPAFGDELLDFMYAGKKLRKWYGEEGMVLPSDGGAPQQEQQQQQQQPGGDDAPREYIVVLDADESPQAEQAVLALILARAPRLRAVVRDAAAARAAFGSYLEPVQAPGGGRDAGALAPALRGAAALVVCGRLGGGVLAAARAARVPHLVLLSSVGAGAGRGGGLAALLGGGGGEAAALADARREAEVVASGLTYTVVRVGRLLDEPGGECALRLEPGGAPAGALSREDAAAVLAAAARRDPARGSAVIAVSAAGPGAPPEDWDAALNACVRVAA